MSPNSRKKFFSYYICLMIERAGSGSISDLWIRIREAQKHVDPMDPDSDQEHCLKLRYAAPLGSYAATY
jgi:hypothetical protein